ncbi:hypothetical protein AMTR_s00057p00217720 [Amborella trichopoda]|uniref:Uncharacterized protein n=1 Tax=Amborella trichopoda TaxID=13333 RepID=U5D9F4_AMBTC|nr:hypothetical protein AMTR_s00057p00217720 [Amborella trichopoda]
MELSGLKKTLNVEVEQLRSEFQELRNTLQQQQEDVTASLRNLVISDLPKVEESVKATDVTKEEDNAKESDEPKVKELAKESDEKVN